MGFDWSEPFLLFPSEFVHAECIHTHIHMHACMHALVGSPSKGAPHCQSLATPWNMSYSFFNS